MITSPTHSLYSIPDVPGRRNNYCDTVENILRDLREFRADNPWRQPRRSTLGLSPQCSRTLSDVDRASSWDPISSMVECIRSKPLLLSSRCPTFGITVNSRRVIISDIASSEPLSILRGDQRELPRVKGHAHVRPDLSITLYR